jgi:ABC-type polysaccharide/polyol phosphate transport system ATPase subunit
MWYGLQDIARATLIPRGFRSGHFNARMQDAVDSSLTHHFVDSSKAPPLRKREFWALRNISFKIEKGECIGIIGANGAGKSTLFSIISGIYGPTEGSVEIQGRLQALIALGAGFHPLLSGRENVYINAAILGLSSREIDNKLEKIIDFAGIGDFIDAPIRSYSSGMLVRLGFSIAIHVDPDVLLIDEVLAVGDAAFQRKCTEYSRRLVNSGKTIMMVSHNPLFVRSMCTEVIWLSKGRIMSRGPSSEVLHAYNKAMLDKERQEPGEGFPVVIRKVYWTDLNRQPLEQLPENGALYLVVEIESIAPADMARMIVHFNQADTLERIIDFSMYHDGFSVSLSKGLGRVLLKINVNGFAKDTAYVCGVNLRDWLCAGKVAETHITKPFTGAAAAPDMNPYYDRHVADGNDKHARSAAYEWKVEGAVQLNPPERTDLSGL